MALPRVVWNGTELAVVTGDVRDVTDEGTCRDVAFFRLSPAGDEVTPAVTLRTGPEGEFIDVDVAWTGSSYGVVWTDGRPESERVVFRALSADGSPLGDAIDFAGGGPAYEPAIAWSDGAFAIVWTDAAAGTPVLRFRRFDPSGAPLGPERELITGAAQVLSSVLAADGAGLVLASQVDTEPGGGGDEIRLSRLTSAGERRRPDIVLSTTALSAFPADVVWTGSELVVAWTEYVIGPPPSSRLQLARIDESGKRTETTVATSSHFSHGQPSLAWSGSELAIAWQEVDDVTVDVLYQRLTAEGVPIDAPTRHRGRALPALAWVGDGYLLVQGFLGLRPVHIP